MPTLYLPHGGGPCFFMDWTMGPADTWDRTAQWLRGLGDTLPAKPTALLVVSAHWETAVPSVLTAPAPALLFDYHGFPAHTYELTWPAPGAPELASRVRSLLGDAGIETGADDTRGFDHGVFVPLKLVFPDAGIPTTQLSLRRGLAPAEHLAVGRALASLRDDGVFIIGSGMSYHNMRAFNSDASRADSAAFDVWLTEAVQLDGPEREARLEAWTTAPRARECHPREEHLLPLMVCAGASRGDSGVAEFRDEVMGAVVSAYRFG